MKAETAIRHIFKLVKNSDLNKTNYTTGLIKRALHDYELRTSIDAINELCEAIHNIIKENNKNGRTF